MKTFIDLLGFNDTQELAQNNNDFIYLGTKIEPSTKHSTPVIPRVDLTELELVYYNDRVVFNSSNKVVQTIMSRPFRLTGEPDPVKLLQMFMDNVGKVGNDKTWKEMLRNIFYSQILFGKAWVENLWNIDNTKILDWDIIDTKTMDYAKNAQKQIVMDALGVPVGYTQTIPYVESIPESLRRYKTPMNVSLDPNQIFLPRDKVAQIKMIVIGDGFYPIGLVEPIYKSALRKLNMEEAMANAFYSTGFPYKVVYIGDEKHPATPQLARTAIDATKNMSYKTAAALPYYTKLELLNASKNDNIRGQIDYFNEQEVTGMGVPMPFATGLGTSTNKNTLDIESMLFNLTLRDIIDRTVSDIRKYLFKPLLLTNPAFYTTVKVNGKTEKILKVEIPDYVQDYTGVGAEDDFARRLKDYAKSGVVLPQAEILAKIKEFEKL